MNFIEPKREFVVLNDKLAVRLTSEERDAARNARLDQASAESPLVKFARVWAKP